jgi:hypothetical protein
MFPVDAILAVALSASPGAPQMPCGGCNSTTPACIMLVGSYGGAPDAAAGQFTVIVRDLANNPLVGATVVIDISNAIDMAICSDQHDPSAVVDCAGGRVSKLTASDGSVTFTILGHSNGAGNASSLLNSGRIFSNGTRIQSPTVAAYDLDGANGVGAADLSAWLTDFGSGNPYGRSDYDCNGTVGAGDLSFWLTEFGAGTSAASCAVACP